MDEPAQLVEEDGGGSAVPLEYFDPFEPVDHRASFVHFDDGSGAEATRMCRIRAGTRAPRRVYSLRASRRSPMRRLMVVAAVATSVLAATTGAQAKAPPSGFEVCGPAACTSVSAFADAEPLAINLFYGGEGSATLWTPNLPAASFYAVHWSFDPEQNHTGYYVPLLNAFRYVSVSGPESLSDSAHWMKLGGAGRTILERLTSTLQPYAPPVPSRVTVGGKPVQDPASYLRLWSVGKATYTWPATGFMAIRFTSDTPSPWTDRAAQLSVSRRGAFLMRDSTVYRIPAQLARLVRAHASLQ
jgi:hypothetical protein